MEIEVYIAQLNKEILRLKMTDPTNHLQIRKLQLELDKLYENKPNPNKYKR
jgi:hypothetical protein